MPNDKKPLTRYGEQLSFAKIVRANISFFEITRSAGQILEYICAVSKKTSDQDSIDPFCFLSNKAIAKGCCGLSSSTVSRGLKQLEVAGLIKRNLVGNGKRFIRPRDRKYLPVASYIGLGPLHDHIYRLNEYESAIRDGGEALEDRRDAITAHRDTLLIKADKLSSQLTTEQEQLRQSIINKRPARLKGDGLSRLEANLSQFENIIEQIELRAVALIMTGSGSQNDNHKEPKTDYVKQSNEDLTGSSDLAFQQEDIAGFRLIDLQQMLSKAFDIPGIDKNNLEGVSEAHIQAMRLTPNDFRGLEFIRNGQTLVSLVILYIAQMDPINPKAYVEALGQKAKLGEFCIRKTLEKRYRTYQYGLKTIKVIKEGSGSDG